MADQDEDADTDDDDEEIVLEPRAPVVPDARAVRQRRDGSLGAAGAPSTDAGGEAVPTASPGHVDARGREHSSGDRRRAAGEREPEPESDESEPEVEAGEWGGVSRRDMHARITQLEFTLASAQAAAERVDGLVADVTRLTAENAAARREVNEVRGVDRALFRDAAQRRRQHARAMKIIRVVTSVKVSQLENSLNEERRAHAMTRRKAELLEAFYKAHAPFFGPRALAPTGAHCFAVSDGRLAPKSEHRARIARCTRYLHHELGGAAATSFDIARRATASPRQIAQLGLFSRYNVRLQARVDHAAEKAGKGQEPAERSFIAKVLAPVGAKKMKEVNDAVYDGHVIDIGDDVKLRKTKVAITSSRLRSAKARLVGRYLHGGAAPIAKYVPKITAVQDDKGKKIGAVADVKNAMIFASICVLESEEHQKTFAPLFDENTRALGERHVPLLAGLTRDLFPLNKRAAVTQMSAFNANMLSSSNSPHMQMPISFTREKEDSAYMHEQYAAADRAHAELRASGLAGGVEVELTPPPNAKWCPPHLRNVRGKFYLHFVGGWFEHNDGKMDALLYRAARGSASTARCGGIRFNVKKVKLLKPRGRIVKPDDPTKTAADYVWHTDSWIKEAVDGVVAEVAKLRSSEKLSDDAINDFCAQHGHAFSLGLSPYGAVRVALWDPLHMDNNLAQGTIEQYNRLAEDMAEHFKLKYDDPRSPHRRLHAALRATGRRLGRHVDALEVVVMMSSCKDCLRTTRVTAERWARPA